MTLRRVGLLAAAALWVVGIAIGLPQLWAFENTPGAMATAPDMWPVQSRLSPPVSRPALVVLLHPMCTCSRATVAELSRLMARVQGKVDGHVLILAAPEFGGNGSGSDLWDLAAAIPGVTVRADHRGTEARQFGGATSGQVLLYDTSHRIRFAGGITPSRGHEGANAGRAALEFILAGDSVPVAAPAVFGCALFAPSGDKTVASANERP